MDSYMVKTMLDGPKICWHRHKFLCYFHLLPALPCLHVQEGILHKQLVGSFPISAAGVVFICCCIHLMKWDIFDMKEHCIINLLALGSEMWHEKNLFYVCARSFFYTGTTCQMCCFFFKDLVGGYEEKDAELHHRVCGLIWCVTLQWIMRLCLKST